MDTDVTPTTADVTPHRYFRSAGPARSRRAASRRRLRHQVEARNATIATLEARNRRLEGALRDMTQAASQAGRVLDGAS